MSLGSAAHSETALCKLSFLVLFYFSAQPTHVHIVLWFFCTQESQLDKLRMSPPFSAEQLGQGGVPGIRTAFEEVTEDKARTRFVIEIDPEIQGKIFGFLLQFIYTGDPSQFPG